MRGELGELEGDEEEARTQRRARGTLGCWQGWELLMDAETSAVPGGCPHFGGQIEHSACPDGPPPRWLSWPRAAPSSWVNGALLRAAPPALRGFGVLLWGWLTPSPGGGTEVSSWGCPSLILGSGLGTEQGKMVPPTPGPSPCPGQAPSAPVSILCILLVTGHSSSSITRNPGDVGTPALILCRIIYKGQDLGNIKENKHFDTERSPERTAQHWCPRRSHPARHSHGRWLRNTRNPLEGHKLR